MNRNVLLGVAFATALLQASPAYAGPFPQSVETRARAAADQGPEALRQFIHRTRMIYALDYADFYKPGAETQFDSGAETAGYADGGEPVATPDPQAAYEAERERLWRDMLFE